MVIWPYLHFHFFWRARQFYSHWISHIPSSSAPLEQVLNKQQHTTSAVTAAWISNCFFVCLLLKPFLKLSWLDWLEGLCKNPYLTFHSSQIPDCKDRETRRNMLFFLFPYFFSHIREIWFLLSHTQSEVQSQSGLCILCRSLMRTSCYRMVDGLPYKTSLVFHKQIVFQFGTIACPRVSSSVFKQW